MSDAHSANEKEQPQLDDVEKAAADHHKEHHKPNIVELLHLQEGIVYERHPEKHARWYQRLLDYGLEDNGIMPVPLELRTSTEYNQLFTVFFTCLLCLLP